MTGAPLSPKRGLALSSSNVQRITKKSAKVKRKVNVHKETKSESELTVESTPASYWKELAEERRIKLEKALEENKDLSEMLQTRQEEINEMQEERDELMKENKILRAKAQKANELEELIAQLVPSASDAEDEDDDRTKED